MFKKLLQAAAVLFLVLSFAIAIFSNEALGSTANPYYGSALMAFVFSYPLVALVIVWEHRSSKNLKYWSAGVGFIATLACVYSVGLNVFNITDPDQLDEQLILLLYFFVFVACLTAVAGRVLKLLWLLPSFNYGFLQKYLLCCCAKASHSSNHPTPTSARQASCPMY